MAGLMEGRCVLVTGVRNRWSIAWHVAQALQREGANIAFSVYGEREEGVVGKLLAGAGYEAPIIQCDAQDDAQVEALFDAVGSAFGGRLDGLLHSIASAKREELDGEFAATSRDGFALAHEASAYTLVSLARGARPLLKAAGGGSVVTLTYIGSQRAVPHYNVMGVAKASLEASVRYLAVDLGPENIRVNAVSAGPLKTASASGVRGFDALARLIPERAPLRRATDPAEVADTVLFLLSPLGRGVTAEVLYVDAGYHAVGA
jgi:enoyl-[acyl-carrier protein] reductase I